MHCIIILKVEKMEMQTWGRISYLMCEEHGPSLLRDELQIHVVF